MCGADYLWDVTNNPYTPALIVSFNLDSKNITNEYVLSSFDMLLGIIGGFSGLVW